jgi:hypothetical protein
VEEKRTSKEGSLRMRRIVYIESTQLIKYLVGNGGTGRGRGTGGKREKESSEETHNFKEKHSERERKEGRTRKRKEGRTKEDRNPSKCVASLENKQRKKRGRTEREEG